MKKLLIASLCGAFVLGFCAFATGQSAQPNTAEASGMLIHVLL